MKINEILSPSICQVLKALLSHHPPDVLYLRHLREVEAIQLIRERDTLIQRCITLIRERDTLIRGRYQLSIFGAHESGWMLASYPLFLYLCIVKTITNNQ